MVIQEPAPGVIDISATMVIAEGLENSMSIAHPEVAHRGWKIIGVPGISLLENVPAKAGDRIIVFQDSDPPDHPAQLGLQAGIDSLILQGAQVRRTEWSEIGDANAILQAKGPAELKRLLARPVGAPLKFTGEKLSIDGEIARLAKLSPTEYEKERKKVAKDSEWRVTVLDKAVARLRPAPTSEADDGSTTTGLSVPEDPPFVGPIPRLDTILKEIRKHIARFVAVTPEQLTTVVLWIAAAHLMHISSLDLQLFPKLAIQSKDPASGKTTLLSLIWNCLPRAKLWTFPTGAYLVRALEQARFSLCLDELQYAEDRNLLRVINASQHKPLAYVPLLVPDHKGAYIPHEYFVWAPMALARLGQFSTAQQSRSIVLWMMPKLRGEKRERLHRPIVPGLALCRQQLAAWVDSLEEWVEPKIPSALQNRDIDNWVPLLFVAQQAGGEWPELATKAVEEMLKTERLPTLTERLLASIWRCFQPYPDVDPVDAFLASKELMARLVGDEEEDWDKINVAGKPITFQWLRERLANLLQPDGSQSHHYIDADGVRRHERGYSFMQFKHAFASYLGGEHPSAYRPDDTHTYKPAPADQSGTSGPSGRAGKKGKDSATVSAPDGAPDAPSSGAASGAAAPSKSAGLPTSDPDGPDVPDQPAGASSVGVSLLITEAQKAVLRDLGYTTAQIRKMSPAVAHRILGLTGNAGEWSWTEEQPSTAEPEKPQENSEAAPRPTARPRQAEKNSGDHSAAGSKAPQLDLPDPAEPMLLEYAEGSIADEVRRLHAANPKRSLAWIAKQSGQPRSVVREILGDGEGAP
jgi:hypothetical protein